MFSLTRLASEFSGVPTKELGIFSFLCALPSTVLAQMGGWNASLSFLVWLVVGDYFTGMAASLIEGTGLKSKIGFKGIVKKAVIFLMVLVGHKMDLALGINIAMNMLIYFYIVNELISLGENADRMGVPVPKQLVKIVEVLKGRAK